MESEGERSRSFGGIDLRAYEQFVQESRENKNRLKALKRELGNSTGKKESEETMQEDQRAGSGKFAHSLDAQRPANEESSKRKDELSLLEEIEQLNNGLREKLSPDYMKQSRLSPLSSATRPNENRSLQSSQNAKTTYGR